MTVLLGMLLAHLAADFVWQSDVLCDDKRKRKASAFLAHGVQVLVLTVVPALLCGAVKGLVLATFVAVTHVLTDALTGPSRRERSDSVELGVFALDQALHVGIVILGWRAACSGAGIHLPDFTALGQAAGPGGTAMAALDKVLAVVNAYLAAMFGGAVLVRKLLDATGFATPPDSGSQSFVRRSGRYVGILERGIIVTLVLSGALSSVALVVAAKSLARFSELNDREFAEYYLVGTLASVLVALTVARLAQVAFGL